MEPPPFGSGNLDLDHHGNGRVQSHPSMEPPPFGSGNSHIPGAGGVAARYVAALQWSHRLSAVETRHDALTPTPARGPDTFNGATAFRQWKPRQTRTADMAGSGTVASMEPPPFGSGNMTDSMTAIPKDLARDASMEPPPFGSGNHAYSVVTHGTPTRTSLQWSHRLSAVETSISSTYVPPCGLPPFNGATAFRQWKRQPG